jgi:hypothetical protein
LDILLKSGELREIGERRMKKGPRDFGTALWRKRTARETAIPNSFQSNDLEMAEVRGPVLLVNQRTAAAEFARGEKPNRLLDVSLRHSYAFVAVVVP